MIPQPSIETTRLVLRPLRTRDEAAIFDYAKRPDIGIKAGWNPHQNIHETRAFIQQARKVARMGHPPVYGVTLKSDGKLIGTVQLHTFYKDFKADIGMVCHPDYQRQGYMKEASRAMLVYAFDYLNLKRVGYWHYPDNDASKGLRQALGFTYEGVLKKYHKRADGLIVDFVASSYTDEDYALDFNDIYFSFKQTLVFR